MCTVVKSKRTNPGTKKAKRDTDGSNAKKKGTKSKVTGRRRRFKRREWSRRIPIEPNVKGSVIFANGTAQELDDPCKILSVNFSSSSLYPESSVERKKQIEERTELVPSEKTISLSSGDGRLNEQIQRQKKVSQLDNTVRSFGTNKKTLVTVRKCNKSDLRRASIDNINSSLDVRNYPNSSSSDAFGDYLHAHTTNNLRSIFERKGEFDEKNETEPSPRVDLMKNTNVILPGLTRPVKEKPASTNLLLSRTTTSISKALRSKGFHQTISDDSSRSKCNQKQIEGLQVQKTTTNKNRSDFTTKKSVFRRKKTDK